MRTRYFAVLLGVACFLTACATHDGFEKNYDGTIEPYGFFSGLWHGFIFPFVFIAYVVAIIIALIASIFSHDHPGYPGLIWVDVVNHMINFTGKPNTGLFYFIGYMIGLGQSLGGGTAANQKRQ